MIDFHTHAFVNALAHRAISSISAASGGLTPYTDGTLTGLMNSMDKNDVEHAVILNIATRPAQQKDINNWAATVNHGKIHAFGSIHPDAPDVMEELERICALGLSGVKLHPEYQNFYVDEERMFPIYRKIAALGLIAVFHAGADLGFALPAKASPAGMARALSVFDGAPVVAAHMGGLMLWDEVLEHLCGLPVYFDTSFCYGRIPRRMMEEILQKHGVEKILFGTDLPWSDASLERKLIDSLSLNEKEKHLILHENAARLLKLNERNAR